METVQKYPEVKLEILPMDFFQTCQETKSPNRTHEKKSGSKVSNFVHGKNSKNQEAKFENLTRENLAFFLGDVQPKMCGINFPKKQTKLLSVVIKNKQSCYQLLSCKYQ